VPIKSINMYEKEELMRHLSDQQMMLANYNMLPFVVDNTHYVLSIDKGQSEDLALVKAVLHGY
jgi:hypothetical protein